MQDRLDRVLRHKQMKIPTFIYGTAWKEGRTQELTEAALAAGFLGIDTANQRLHYHEAGVGKAVESILNQGWLSRSDLFLQTKYTYAAGHDHRLPFDPETAYAHQVRQSLQSSLEHLRSDYVDAFILHGPATMHGFGNADREVWRAMEQLQASGSVKSIGVSNVGYDQLVSLIGFAEVQPTFVQNRCFARDRWDARIRAVCRSNGILYQGFSLLTANAAELNRAVMHTMAGRLGRTLAQIVFRFSLQIGMIALTGTRSRQHMQEDLSVYDFELGASEMETIENIAA